MTTSPEPAPAIVEPAPRPKRSRLKIVLIVIAALIAVIIAIGVGAFLLVNNSTKDAQKISAQLVTAVQNGDGAAAYALTGPSFRAATNEAQLSELVTNLSSLVTKDKSSPNSKAISVSTDNCKIAVLMSGICFRPDALFVREDRSSEQLCQALRMCFSGSM